MPMSDSQLPSKKLLRCPFCGHGGALHIDDRDRWRQIVCGGCGAKAPEQMTEGAAYAAWNRRPGHEPCAHLPKQAAWCPKCSAQPPAPEWQPIETAPKDGTPVLVSNDERDGAWIAYYHPVYTSGYRPDNPWSSLMLNMRWHKTKWASTVPTKWMPIPAVATSTKCEGQS